ncbi:unnamed protein product [Ectocarpus sp. CCAP 1310/34]|nr:unnamed protein product [Ectocarpus sp. CCAP 1310/34]
MYAMKLDGELRPDGRQVLKHLQNVCIVYACLAVKRNAGIVSTQAKHAAAAQGYKDIAVPGFFKWLQENLDKEDFFLQPWLTFEDNLGTNYRRAAKTNAIEYLLDEVYRMESGTGDAEDPIELEERGGGEGEGSEDGSGESSPTESEDGGGGKQKGTEEAVMKKEPEDDTTGNGDDAPSEEITREEGGFPQRPKKWMHQYLLTFCLIGRPCSSEDPDLRTARKTSGAKGRGASGAKGRGGKQKAKKGSPGTSDESGSEASGAYTEVDLSSNAIRMFTGAGEIQSQAQATW